MCVCVWSKFLTRRIHHLSHLMTTVLRSIVAETFTSAFSRTLLLRNKNKRQKTKQKEKLPRPESRYLLPGDKLGIKQDGPHSFTLYPDLRLQTSGANRQVNFVWSMRTATSAPLRERNALPRWWRSVSSDGGNAPVLAAMMNYHRGLHCGQQKDKL